MQTHGKSYPSKFLQFDCAIVNYIILCVPIGSAVLGANLGYQLKTEIEPKYMPFEYEIDPFLKHAQSFKGQLPDSPRFNPFRMSANPREGTFAASRDLIIYALGPKFGSIFRSIRLSDKRIRMNGQHTLSGYIACSVRTSEHCHRLYI